MAEHDIKPKQESPQAPESAPGAAATAAGPRLQLKHSLRGVGYDQGAERLRFKGAGPGGGGVGGDALGTARAGLSGAGAPIPHQAEMESRFGADFSGVRAHTGPAARDASKALGADAFTLGNRVGFSSATPDKATVAHELTHVVQQSAGTAGSETVGSPGSAPEREARAAEGAVSAGQTPVVAGGGAPALSLRDNAGQRTEWEARTTSLAGQWARTNRDAPGRTRERLDPDGGWGRTGEVLARGTQVFVAGIDVRDGAVLVNVPQRGRDGRITGYRPVWLEQSHVTQDSPPADLQPQQDRRRQNTTTSTTTTATTDAADQQRQQRQRQAAHNMGTVRRFDNSFYRAAGGLLDALVPTVGDKGKLQVNVNLPVTQTGNVKVAFQFSMEGERNDSGLKVRCEAAGGVLAQADLWLVEVFARAMLFGYIETQGDSGAEIFRLFSLALYDRVHDVSEDAAEAVWGDRFLPDTLANMDSDDYAESGLGVEFSAGVSAQNISGGGSREASGQLRYQQGTRLTNNRGRLNEQQTRQGSFKANFSAAPWGGEFELKVGSVGGTPTGEIQIQGSRSANLMEFNGPLSDDAIKATMVHWVGGAVGTIYSIISRTSGVDGNTARRVGAISRIVQDCSVGGTIADAATRQAILRRLSAPTAAKFGQKLCIKAEWSGRNVSLSVELQRTSEIEVGDNPRALVYVLLENTSRIFALSGQGTV